MLISHSAKGYNCQCFRCQEPDSHRFIPHGQRSIAEIERHKQELAAHKSLPPHLPSDFTTTIPPQYAWFLKYGISLDVANSYGFGYSEFFHRIVMPIYRGLELQAVHMRAVNPDDKPKYLNLGKPKEHLLFWPDNDFTYDKRLVIVEDILSAIKVNLAGFNAVALNGSDITDYQAFLLASNQAVRYVWLDADKAGQKGAKKACNQLLMQGTADVRIVESEADPKTYNKDDINFHIERAKTCLI